MDTIGFKNHETNYRRPEKTMDSAFEVLRWIWYNPMVGRGQVLVKIKPFRAYASRELRLLPRLVEGLKPDVTRENDAQSQTRPSEDSQNRGWHGDSSPASQAIPADPNQKDASLTDDGWPLLPDTLAVSHPTGRT